MNFRFSITLLAGISIWLLFTGCEISRDMSDFDIFEYKLNDDGCADVDSVGRGAILRSEDNSYRLELSVFEEVPQTEDGCDGVSAFSPYKGPMGCYRRVELPPRLLSEDEMGRVRDVFQNITLRRGRIAQGTCVQAPCPVKSMQWDDRSWVNGFHTCGPGKYTVLTSDTTNKVEELLNTLKKE